MNMPTPSLLPARSPVRTLLGYSVMIAATAALFFVIRTLGDDLVAPPAGPQETLRSSAAPAAVSHPLLHLLLALGAVIMVGRVLARLFGLLHQPPVIGEVLAGICLGPSLLGRLAPEWGAYLLPPSVAPSLSTVAQLGVILYMFVVGLDLNLSILRKQGHVTLAISHASIIAPFLLGAALALWLYPMLSHDGVSFTAFALFLAVSMSITAFPVLARILTDRKMNRTELGAMALACAATDDVTAWCLLALVVGVVQNQLHDALWVALLTVAYVAAMMLVVRPLAARWVARHEGRTLTTATMGWIMVGVLASSLITESIGIHAIFGAFLFGAMIPYDSSLARQMIERLEDLVTALLLPAFFAFTGMRTQIGLVSGWQAWLVCLAIIAVATAGKFGGTWIAARLLGLGSRDASGLGILMNTRGLMELIVLNIGLDLGVISPTLFAMMVLMAIVTTVATSPILELLYPTAVRRMNSAKNDQPSAAQVG